MVRIFAVCTPGRTSITRTKLRSSRPALTVSSTASATSAPSRKLRMRCDPPALSERPAASLSVVFRSVCEDFSTREPAEHQAGENRNPERESQHRQIDAHVLQHGKHVGHDAAQRVHAPDGQQQAQHAARHGEHQAFGEQLADDARSAPRPARREWRSPSRGWRRAPATGWPGWRRRSTAADPRRPAGSSAPGGCGR